MVSRAFVSTPVARLPAQVFPAAFVTLEIRKLQFIYKRAEDDDGGVTQNIHTHTNTISERFLHTNTSK